MQGAGPAARCLSPPGSATAFPASCSSAASSTWSSPVLCCGGHKQVRGDEKREAYPVPKPFTCPTLTQLAAVIHRRWCTGSSLPTCPLLSKGGDTACPLPTLGCSAPSDQPPGLTGTHKEQLDLSEPLGCCLPHALRSLGPHRALSAWQPPWPHSRKCCAPGFPHTSATALGTHWGRQLCPQGSRGTPAPAHRQRVAAPRSLCGSQGGHMGDRRAESKIPAPRLPPSPGGTWWWGAEPSRPVPSQ